MEDNKQPDVNQEIAELKKELQEIKQNNNLANSPILNKIIDDYVNLNNKINSMEINNKPYEVVNNNIVVEPKPEPKPKFELN